jgi:tungstate transport system permease protein
MAYILEILKEAILLLINFDKEIYGIIGLSLMVSMSSTLISSIISIPLALILALKNFYGKELIMKFIYTAMSLPPVVVGLVCAIFISRRGPLGNLGLMFTPQAMIIAQVILVAPIICGIVYSNSKKQALEIKEVCRTLGGNRRQILLLLTKELHTVISVALISGFGRAISEVGAVMIVGGNIKGHTRVMTSFIAMNNNMGAYNKSLAMGIILLLISFTINSLMYNYTMGASLWKSK